MDGKFYQAYPDISDYQKITTLSFVFGVPSNFRYCIQVLDFPVLGRISPSAVATYNMNE